MRLQITDPAEIAKISKFLVDKSRSQSLCLRARKTRWRDTLEFAYGDRSLEIKIFLAEPGSVEMDKDALADLFGVLTSNCPIDIWTDGAQVHFKQRHFVTTLNVLPESDCAMFTSSPAGMERKLHLLKSRRKK
jgi:hypothetical protein